MKFEDTIDESFHEKAYFEMLRLNSNIEKLVKESLKPLKLTHLQLNVLSILEKEKPKPVRYQLMREKIMVLNPDTTRLLDRMESRGWIARSSDPNMRRKQLIEITPLGSEVYFKGHVLAKKSVEEYFKFILNPIEAANLYNMLQKINLKLNTK